MPVPPVCVWASPFRLFGGRVEWRGCVCGDVPCLDWVWHLVLSCPPRLHCPALHCVCCHSIVGLGVCLCGRVALLWNGGDGLGVCWNGGVCDGVWC